MSLSRHITFRTEPFVVDYDILACSPLDTHCVCVPVIMYVTHSVSASKRVEATCSALHEGANKACNAVCAQNAMHFADGVSWDACLPGVVTQADRYTTRDHVIIQSVMQNVLPMATIVSE